MMARHDFKIAPMDKALRRAGLSRAWAVVRPFPGKEGLLLPLLQELKWEVRRPVVEQCYISRGRKRVTTRLALPGYLFVRPPVGQRRQLQYLPHTADVLKIVIFDRLLLQVEVEVAKMTVEGAAAAPPISKKVRRWKPSETLRHTGDMTAFQRLAALLAVENRAAAVDKEPVKSESSGYIRDSAAVCGSIDDYYGTDEIGTECSERPCEAMVRRRYYYQ